MATSDLARHGFFDGHPFAAQTRRKPKVEESLFGPPTEDSDAEMVIEGRLSKVTRTSSQASEDYDAGTITVGRVADFGEVVQVLPFDSERERAVLQNTGTATVLIGKMSSGLAQGNGFTLVAGASLEMKTRARVFAVVVSSAPAATTCPISVLIERGLS